MLLNKALINLYFNWDFAVFAVILVGEIKKSLVNKFLLIKINSNFYT